MTRTLWLRAILMTLLFPGTVTVVLPYFILDFSNAGRWPDLSAFAFVALSMIVLGFAILFRCIWGFAFHGKGTLAPIDPPKVLVVHGLYRYTRNPMYLAVISILLSEALFFGSVALLVYTAVVAVIFHLFVTLYEEPHLRSEFGEAYTRYASAVPRWRFTSQAYVSGSAK